MKWHEDVIPFSNEMWRILPLDLRVRLIREGHIDPDDDDADLGDDITPASVVEPEWRNDTSVSVSTWSNSTPGDDNVRVWGAWTSASPKNSPIPTPSFITTFPPREFFPVTAPASSKPRPSYEAWCSALEDHNAGFHTN